jgi:hypothetical protein
MRTQIKAVFGGTVAALVSFVPLFLLVDRMFIAYWEWQHEGRPMKFTLWADERALPIALLLSAAVFYLTARFVQRRLSVDQQIKRRSLVIGAASGVVLIYFSIVAYVSIMVSRLMSNPH